MMVETILESSQDFGTGMSNGSLPQWKRELLQRRAARSRPAAPPPAPPPPPPPPPPPLPPADDDDEELRYGPGIVKRLQSRYLSLALRDAPRRRPSVMRRAASLEHMLDERPPSVPRAPAPPRHAPARAPRPASLAAPPALPAPAPRRDVVKRARSVDALSRLEARNEPPPLVSPPSPPPPPPPVAAPRPPVPRAARPPRRPAPLLRDAERPPPDLVRSTLRKFESPPPRRTAPAARVSAVLRGLEAQPRTSTPEPRGRSPSPAAADLSAIEDPEAAAAETKRVSRAALESIASAGSTVRYCFEAGRGGSHLPPVAATNPVLLGRARLAASPRRVGVIRPMPAPALEHVPPAPAAAPAPAPRPDDLVEKTSESPGSKVTTPEVDTPPTPTVCLEKKEHPPSALVEPTPRSPPQEGREVSPEHAIEKPEPLEAGAGALKPEPLMNGHGGRELHVDPKASSMPSKIGHADIDRAWSGSGAAHARKEVLEKSEDCAVNGVVAWRGAARLRGAAPAGNSVVFNFSDRKEVPDYIENDGCILRASRRNKIKFSSCPSTSTNEEIQIQPSTSTDNNISDTMQLSALIDPGESGVVVLRPEALAGSDSEGEDDGDGDGAGGGGPPSPCAVRFVNDNVLINGRSSMPHKPNRDRIAKLKLQFDDSLTRTFEYPSETSLCEEPASPPATPAAAPTAPAAHNPALLANTHIVSAALSRYTPHKTQPLQFQLGVTRHATQHPAADPACARVADTTDGATVVDGGGESEGGADGEPEPGEGGCDSAERPWSEARAAATDLLF